MINLRHTGLSPSITLLGENNTLSEKHYLFLSAEEVNEICQPLKQIGINFFCHDRCYQDGSHIRLCNRPDWMQRYYLKRYHNLINNEFPKESGHICWSSFKDEPLFVDARERFNIFNGVTIIEKEAAFIERFGFGSAQKDRCYYEFYHNHLELLYRFILYYKSKAAELINKSEVNKILLIENKKPSKQELLSQNTHSIDNLAGFITGTDIKRFKFIMSGREIILTKREAQVCYYLSLEKSARNIGNILNLSQRTIESYINTLKLKLNVGYSFEISYIFKNNIYLKSIVEPF